MHLPHGNCSIAVAALTVFAAALSGCQRSTVDDAAPAVTALPAVEETLKPADELVPPAATPKADTDVAIPKGALGPELSTMLPAHADAKLGVPVELRYSFDDAVQVGRPVTLNLAAVPQVDGGNLMLGLKEQPGIQAANTPLTVKAASAGGVYRDRMSVTQIEGGPAEVRVFVKMDLPQGSAFSWYTVPFAPPASAGKR
jgi:hypothetical protein